VAHLSQTLVSEHDSEGEYLGTLLNTNAQVVAALELYNELGNSKLEGSQVDDVAKRLEKAQIATPQPGSNSEPNLFDDFNCAVDDPDEHDTRSPVNDLLGLDFSQSASLANLATPLVPNPVSGAQESKANYDPGTLSDYSDFDDSASLSDEASDQMSGSTMLSPSASKNPFFQYQNLANASPKPPLSPNDPLDPFADSFADSGSNVAPATTHNNLVTSAVV